ncbi:elongation factor P [Rickettsiales endosymbiont of Peranema trichophorum]|uniref:elongation factor P n=1 Tax=Rickettsiales endosymbiont of Peranema trichophorum TaxID=2486577 RepID=UPI0010232670|nr:elongation factor P [Rickettsiales endosymbiont of Peranema trichophorum]RZI46304.1 elongation factor P [Rickettsiales endosymbiont of Peranema trichophorum]
MKIDANSIRVGNILEHDNKLWSVLKTMHTQPGKGGAYVQVELKEIVYGTKNNVRFRSSEFVEKAQLEQRVCQCLYTESDAVVVMDVDNYEQITIPLSFFEGFADFLVEGLQVTVEYYQDRLVTASLPETLTVKVATCEPVVKGQTAAASYKPAVLENGKRIMVPPFISEGDQIIIKTLELEYLEKAK